jgi:hypothetical protein
VGYWKWRITSADIVEQCDKYETHDIDPMVTGVMQELVRFLLF